MYPFDYIHPEINLEPTMKLLNRDMNPEQLKSLAIQPTERQILEVEQIYVFTQDSKLHRDNGAEAVVFFNYFPFCLSLGSFNVLQWRK